MHGRFAVALLALPLLIPGAAHGAVKPGQDIRKVEAYTASAGALVRVTLRAPLRGKIGVSFKRRAGSKGSTRRSTVIKGRRRIDFVFAGDARNLASVTVRTRGERVTKRLRKATDDCAALTRLARKLRPLRKGRPAIRGRLRVIERRRAVCGGGITVPIAPPAAPAPVPAPGFTPPAARFALADGLTPEDPLTAAANVAFNDASQGTDLVEWTWDFGDGATAAGRNVGHAFAQPGRYTVLLTVRNARGQTSAFGQEVFVRAPGTATFDGPTFECPDTGETVTVNVTRVVPSWARPPAEFEYAFASCSASTASGNDLTIARGNAGNVLDAWGREASTLPLQLRRRPALADNSGSVTPSVTVSWS